MSLKVTLWGFFCVKYGANAPSSGAAWLRGWFEFRQTPISIAVVLPFNVFLHLHSFCKNSMWNGFGKASASNKWSSKRHDFYEFQMFNSTFTLVKKRTIKRTKWLFKTPHNIYSLFLLRKKACKRGFSTDWSYFWEKNWKFFSQK